MLQDNNVLQEKWLLILVHFIAYFSIAPLVIYLSVVYCSMGCSGCWENVGRKK